MTAIDRLRATLSSPISIAPLIFFRGAFGLLMLISLLRFAANGWISEQYVLPDFHFSYYGFAWLPRPASPLGLYALFALCGMSTIGILLGWRYRLSVLLFFLSFTYIELLDKTYYLNHYYFVSLVALTMLFLPAHRAFSLDVRAKRVSAVAEVPRSSVALIQLLIGGLYFMAGVAKLQPTWLLEAMPMRLWLPPHAHLPIIGPLLDETWTAYLFSWIGALYDLSIPFLLLWHRSRPWAYISVVAFHGLTALLFPIGMFPWVMMVSSLVFLRPATLETWLRKIGWAPAEPGTKGAVTSLPIMKKGIAYPLISLLLFLLFLFPMRYLAYPGEVFWHEQGYRFSWRVMLMEKAGHAFFYVKDPDQAGEIEVDNRRYLTPAQEKQMSTQADMLIQYAHHLDAVYRTEGVSDPIVRAEVWVSLNGEGSRLYIDPFVDLSEQVDGWAHKSWILPHDSVVTVSDLNDYKIRSRK